MLTDIWQYILDLADNWAAFMTGGIPAALALVIERLRKVQMPVRTFVIVFLAFGFVAASFATWRNEHVARVAAVNKGRNPAVVRQLQEYYAEAGSFYVQITSAETDKEFNEANKSAEEWATQMGHWVTENMGNGAYVRLIQTPRPPPTVGKVRPDRAESAFMFAVIRDNLSMFVENPAWDKP
jgi:hypothetical protein